MQGVQFFFDSVYM